MNIRKTVETVCVIVGLELTVAGAPSLAEAGEIRIVVPPGQQNVESEGAISREVMVREQTVYPATDFAALPATHLMILGYALRPDQSITGSASITYEDLQMHLSTTSAAPGTLSTTFADNLGADATLVFSGDLTLSTQATGTPGGPHDFDMPVMFQTPFEYDPSLGNLLVDIRTAGSTGAMVFDAHRPNSSVRLIYGLDSSSTARRNLPGTYVRRFVFVPEPAPVWLMVIGAVAATGLVGQCRGTS